MCILLKKRSLRKGKCWFGSTWQRRIKQGGSPVFSVSYEIPNTSLFRRGSMGTMRPMPHYITRLTSQDYAFNGFRVAITRMKKNFVRYFSDLEFGSQSQALSEAARVRDAILSELSRCPNDPEAVFARYRKPPLDLPPGLHPILKPMEHIPSSCSLRCSGKVADIHTQLCRQFNIDRSSVLKLALYCLMSTLGQKELQEIGLRPFISFMESLRSPEDPDWVEFATGKQRPDTSCTPASAEIK